MKFGIKKKPEERFPDSSCCAMYARCSMSANHEKTVSTERLTVMLDLMFTCSALSLYSRVLPLLGCCVQLAYECFTSRTPPSFPLWYYSSLQALLAFWFFLLPLCPPFPCSTMKPGVRA